MKGKNKEKQTHKKVTSKKIKGKKKSIEKIPKDYGQSQDKKSQKKSNEIINPTIIFDYKGKLIFYQCKLTDDMESIFKRFALEIKENINYLCFKINNIIIINYKLKFEELVDYGKNCINLLVLKMNEEDMINPKNNNYITAEIIVKKKNTYKRIINTSEVIKRECKMEDYYKYDNEEEIKKNCKIEINGKAIPFNFCHGFIEAGIFKIKYAFTNNMTKTSCMFYECDSLNNIDLSNFNTKNVTEFYVP